MHIFDFLFPNHTCVVCRGELRHPTQPFICDACAATLPLNTEPLTLRDTAAKQWFFKGYAPFKYDRPISGIILQLKYGGRGDVARFLGASMANAWGVTPPAPPRLGVLVPVPLHKKRLRRRGYNQALLLAREVSKITGLPVDEVLIRTRKTTAQKKMDTAERAENTKNAFAVRDKAAIEGLEFIIVDDVFTSGSTVNECARILTQNGAKKVEILVAARA